MRHLRAFLVALILGVPGLALTWLPLPAVAQDPDTVLEQWRAHVRSQTVDGTIWWTSNAAYRDEDGDIESYAMRFVGIPGGVAARGCLWGRRGNETLGPFWEFFMAWDPVEEKALLYQVAPGGAFGLGHSWVTADGLEVAEQTFVDPNGLRSRVRHETRNVNSDTREGASFDWVDGEWAPRRTYTWIRQPAQNPPC